MGVSDVTVRLITCHSQTNTIPRSYINSDRLESAFAFIELENVVLNKIDELKSTVSSNSPDVITVTGICPKNVRDVNIIATTIQMPGYDPFTNNKL